MSTQKKCKYSLISAFICWNSFAKSFQVCVQGESWIGKTNSKLLKLNINGGFYENVKRIIKGFDNCTSSYAA